MNVTGVGVDGDRARLGVEHLEDAGHKPFDIGVVEFALHRDDALRTLIFRLDTEQRGLPGLLVVRHTATPHTQPGNAKHQPFIARHPRRTSAVQVGAVRLALGVSLTAG